MKLLLLCDARVAAPENRYCAPCAQTTAHEVIEPGILKCKKCGALKYSKSKWAELKAKEKEKQQLEKPKPIAATQRV